MSKRKNQASKEGQEIVSLLTENQSSTIGQSTTESTTDNQANANNISGSNAISNNQVNTNNVPSSEVVKDLSNAGDHSTTINKETSVSSINPLVEKESSEAVVNPEQDALSSTEITTEGLKKGKGRIVIDKSYAQILGSTPQNVDPGAPLTPSIIITQQMKDLDVTMEKATAAVLAGKKEEAAFYFRIHEQMKKEKIETSEVIKPKHKEVIVVEDDVCEEDDKLKPASALKVGIKIVENGFTFREGATTDTDSNVGLTPFFEKNINELKLPVPLTIFNDEWQEEAWQYHAEKRVRSDESTKAQNLYSGLPYPHEFSQSYMAWNINYRNFIKTIRNKFKFGTLADWLVKHKDNVEDIRQTECWMVAFRYDIKMRSLLFTEKVTYDDGTKGPIDISKVRQDVKEVCFAKARKCDELSFVDNPYAEGGERFDWDHNTGAPKKQGISRNSSYNSNSSYVSNFVNHKNTQHGSNNHNNNNQSTSSNTPATTSFQNDGKKRKGYQGGNFDPNYVRKGKAVVTPVASSSKT